jgi:putative membrane protein
MTATQGNLASLSRFIFRAPRWYSSLTFAVVIAALAGVAAFDTATRLIPWSDAVEGVFFIGVPTLVAGAATTAVDRWLGGQLTPNRSSLLALFCELLLVTTMVGAGVVTLLTRLDQQFVMDALIVGLAAVFAVRLLVLKAVSKHSTPVAAVPASIQTVAAAVLLFVYSGTIRFLEVGGPLVRSYLSRPQEAPPELLVVTPDDFLNLAVLSVVYAGFVWGFLLAIDRPWQRTLGVSVLDFARGFIGHVAEGSDELEEFFETIGEDATVPVTVLSFRERVRSDGGAVADEESDGATAADGGVVGTEKARFVLPMIHPGPMGDIGGGNLPVRIAQTAEGLAFPPHATAGHDFNLVTEREVETLVDAAERAHDRIEYGPTASRSHRVETGETSLLAQAFADDLLAVNTFAPGYADDVAFSVGLSAMSEARAGGFEEVLLADAHNCNNGLQGENLGHVVPGDSRSFDLIDAAGEAAGELVDADRAPVELGTAWDETEWVPREGIGPLGVRVAVLEVADQRTAYVLVDGNNMEPGLRERLVDAVDADAVEVMTTDTHIVNTVEAENQVGEAIPEAELVALVEDLTAEATADLDPVVAGMASERAEVTVFGNDRTETLASHANAMISMGGALAGAAILVAVALSALLFFLT